MIPEKGKIKCLLFDLDDTLLENSWRVFPAFLVSTFRALRAECGSYGVIRGLRALDGARANTGDATINHERFMQAFASSASLSAERCHALFDQLLPEILHSCSHHFKPIQAARDFLKLMQGEIPIVLATNPVFTEACTKLRIEWAGLDISDFKFVTHSENMYHCKPSVSYYNDILQRLKADGISREECLFIGNDAKNDGAAVLAGITTIIIAKNSASNLTLLRSQASSQASLYQGSWGAIAKHFS